MADSTPATAATDQRFSTLPTDTLRRLLWAAKGAPCTCIGDAGNNGQTEVWAHKFYDCTRCAVIRDVCEAVPDVV